jgi:peptidoglycan/xylan/chitin deacetylase (PgdA/CDA1 family)
VKSLSGIDKQASHGTRPGRGTRDTVRRWKRRLVHSRLRSELRARPRIQGRVLAPVGLFRRLPTTAGLYFPFYHDVLPPYADDLRHHLRTFLRIGQFVTWDEALEILDGRRPLVGPHFCLSFDDGHPSWRDVVLPVLRDLGIPAMFFVISGSIGRGANLSWRDCREMAATGMAFGSHTRSHRSLAGLDDATAAREIRDSKAEIEEQLGREVLDFAAPYGRPGHDFLPRDVDLARDAGYRSFATTLRAPMHPGDSPMWVQRQGLHPAWPLWAVRTRVHD